MFTRGRSLRVTAALLTATALLATSFATSLGAVAKVAVGGGNISADLLTRDTGTGATPTTVSPDNVVGFYLWAANDDNANLSTFSLTASTDATPYGAYWKHPSDTSWTSCDVDITKPLKCTFGAFNAGTGIQVVAAFRLPKTPSTKKTYCLDDGDPNTTPPANAYGVNPTGASWVCVDFQFGSDSGYVPGKNKSRGDAFHWFDAVNTDTGADQAAQFPFCNLAPDATCPSSLLTISDSQTFSKTNPQWTQLQAPPLGAFNSEHGSTGLHVADNVTFDCAAATGLTKCSSANLGQWSQADVNSGEDFSPAYIKLDIGVSGISASRITAVYHFYLLDGTWLVEVIDTPCPDANGPGTASDNAPCLWVTSLKGSSSQVTIWTHFNGKFRLG